MGITQQALANAIRVRFPRINELVGGKRGLTPSTALRLARSFDMSPGFWLNVQMVYDLQQAETKESDVLKTIRRALRKRRGKFSLESTPRQRLFERSRQIHLRPTYAFSLELCSCDRRCRAGEVSRAFLVS